VIPYGRGIAWLALPISFVSPAGCDGLCGNKPTRELPSPERSTRVVAFTRGCGTSVHLSILSASEQLGDSQGNVISADVVHPAAKMKFQWRSSGELLVSYPASIRFSYHATSVDGVRISYAETDTNESIKP